MELEAGGKKWCTFYKYDADGKMADVGDVLIGVEPAEAEDNTPARSRGVRLGTAAVAQERRLGRVAPIRPFLYARICYVRE